jgi:hypothetical protein
MINAKSKIKNKRNSIISCKIKNVVYEKKNKFKFKLKLKLFRFLTGFNSKKTGILRGNITLMNSLRFE